MSTPSLIQSLSGLVTPNLVASLASHLGESNGAVHGALGATLSTVLAGVTKLASADGGAQLANLLRTPGVGADVLGTLQSAVASGGGAASGLLGLGQELAHTVFGPSDGAIATTVAAAAGLKQSSAESLLAAGTPLVLGFLTKPQATNNLSSSALASQLVAHRSQIYRALPAGVGALLGLTGADGHHQRHPFLWFALAGGALIFIALMYGLASDEGRKTAAPPTAAAAPAVVVVVPVAKVYFDLDVSDHWVEGSETLDEVIVYLKGHDTATAAISGYHDPSGNVDHNQELAKARAIVVRDAIVSAGVGADRLSLEKPIATTGSGDMREARRVEVAVKP